MLDVEGLAVVVDEDDDDDGDILDNGDFPGFLGRGATMAPSVAGEGTGALTLTGEDAAYDVR